MEHRKCHGADDERDPIDDEHPTWTKGGDEHPGEERPSNGRGASRKPHERVGLLQPGSSYSRWYQRRRGRLKEGGGQPVHDGTRHQMPDAGVASDQEDADRKLLGRADQVGRQHDNLPGQPIRPNSANQVKGNAAREANREDQAQLGRAASNPQNGEGEGDRHEAVPDRGRRLARPEQPEARLG